MILASVPRRTIDVDDRRVLGALQFVDATTGLPVATPIAVGVGSMVVAGQPGDVRLPPEAVRLVRNRRGLYVIFSAPFFDTYVQTFDAPRDPDEVAQGPLSLQVSVVDAGIDYLPQQFRVALPRTLDPTAPDSVLEPLRVPLLRAPSAGVQDGWAVLRVQVSRDAAPRAPVPGVLVRVFRSPRAANDRPIGEGMTDWRGGVRGEALVPVAGLPHFQPGQGNTVVVTDQLVSIEATRDATFTGLADAPLPDLSRLRAGAGLVRASSEPPNPSLTIVRPDVALRLQPAREYVVRLEMP